MHAVVAARRRLKTFHQHDDNAWVDAGPGVTLQFPKISVFGKTFENLGFTAPPAYSKWLPLEFYFYLDPEANAIVRTTLRRIEPYWEKRGALPRFRQKQLAARRPVDDNGALPAAVDLPGDKILFLGGTFNDAGYVIVPKGFDFRKSGLNYDGTTRKLKHKEKHLIAEAIKKDAPPEATSEAYGWLVENRHPGPFN